MIVNRHKTKTIIIGLILGITGIAASAATLDDAPPILQTGPRHQQVANLVTRFVEQQHYSRRSVDDQLSQIILGNYIEALDSNKHYFLQPDIDYFYRYEQTMDDALKNGNLDPAFDIFRLYRLRAQQHINYALQVLDHEPDFTLDEEYQFDREDLDWVADEETMRGIWKRRIKNDALNLIVADKSWDEAQEILRKRYKRVLKRINKLDSDDVFETFMNSFAHALDPHSSYLSPRLSEEYRIQMSLSYQGIGASLLLDEDFVKVMNVIPGGPAAIDGRLEAEDRIIGVGQDSEGEMVDVVGWELDDVVQMIRGPSGTEIRLQILPANELPGAGEYVLKLVRDQIKLEEQAAKSDLLTLEENGEEVRIGVITVPSFYQDFDARNRGEKDYISTTRDVSRLIGELQEENITGLVLDLRGNGGGHLSEATALTGLFIDHGPVVQYRNSSGHIEVLDDPSPASVYDGPLVILVDRFSASASEIFAAALQDYQRGVIIGQQTFGKGTVQNLYLLDQYSRRVPEPGLGQLTLTVGKYYRVTGNSTQNRGVLPDIDLPSAVDKTAIGESSRKGALPWDQIRSTQFDASDPLKTTISYLATNQGARLTDDPDIRLLLGDIEAIDEIRSRNSVSLNIETRRTERDARRQQQLERVNSRRTRLGEELLESVEDLEDMEPIDVLLMQAAEVAKDLVDMKAGNISLLSQTGQSTKKQNSAAEM